MEVKLNVEYETGLLANADIHAGGIFFCIVHKTILKFLDENKVEMFHRVIDPISPMDQSDVITINQFHVTGRYSFNDRGYLQCLFEDDDLVLIGKAGQDKNIIAFHAYNKHQKRAWSIVVQAPNADLSL